MKRVCALVEAGSVPGRNPLIPSLRGTLAPAGVELWTWDPTAYLDVPVGPPDADLYLIKGDHPTILSAAACLHDTGALCLNTYDATAAAADKARTIARLQRAGLPVPHTQVVGERAVLERLLGSEAKFVKPVRGAHGAGAARLTADEASRAGPGPWLVQDHVEGPGYDLKVYGVGNRSAMRRMHFTPGVIDAPRLPVSRPDPAIVGWARQAAAVCDLVCYGVDFILSEHGPVIVDVNAFPGYRGVSEATVWLREQILTELGIHGSNSAANAGTII